jgi:3-hydroxyisobutyrate dehydrogenase
VVDALEGGPLVSPWQAAKLQRIANGEFSAQFALSLALKDVRLALQAANDRYTALAGLADEWQMVVDSGLGDQDLTVVTRVLEEQEGPPCPHRLHDDVRAGGPEATGARRRPS